MSLATTLDDVRGGLSYDRENKHDNANDLLRSTPPQTSTSSIRPTKQATPAEATTKRIERRDSEMSGIEESPQLIDITSPGSAEAAAAKTPRTSSGGNMQAGRRTSGQSALQDLLRHRQKPPPQSASAPQIQQPPQTPSAMSSSSLAMPGTWSPIPRQ